MSAELPEQRDWSDVVIDATWKYGAKIFGAIVVVLTVIAIAAQLGRMSA